MASTAARAGWTRVAVIGAVSFIAAALIAGLAAWGHAPRPVSALEGQAPAPVAAQQLPAQDCRISGITPPCWTRYDAGSEVIWNRAGQVVTVGDQVHVGQSA